MLILLDLTMSIMLFYCKGKGFVKSKEFYDSQNISSSLTQFPDSRDSSCITFVSVYCIRLTLLFYPFESFSH